ncbi:MAG TPA: hypothetical protein QF446_00930 [Planctomycetota bacterium]|nr:hypothetical protein [Planctomycetota bacterium]
MKAPILISLALFLGNSHDLSVKHEKGQVQRTSFTFEEQRTLSEMSSTVNGENQGELDDMQHEQSYEASGVFVDRTVGSTDSKRTVFDREYEELGLEMAVQITPPFGESVDEEASGESDLEGETVRFTWDADEEDFSPAFPEGEGGDEDLLEGLEAEFPWASYLPEEGVDTDDEWDIAPEVLIQTIEVGGDMSMTNDGEGMLGSAMSEVSGGRDGEYGGEMTATLVGVNEVDGRDQAEISIEVDVSLVQDNTEIARADMQESDDFPEGAVVPDLESMVIETTYEGEGTLVWDVEGGYLVSLELELELEFTHTIQLLVEFGGQSMDIEQIMTFEGERSMSIEVEVE